MPGSRTNSSPLLGRAIVDRGRHNPGSRRDNRPERLILPTLERHRTGIATSPGRRCRSTERVRARALQPLEALLLERLVAKGLDVVPEQIEILPGGGDQADPARAQPPGEAGLRGARRDLPELVE